MASWKSSSTTIATTSTRPMPSLFDLMEDALAFGPEITMSLLMMTMRATNDTPTTATTTPVMVKITRHGNHPAKKIGHQRLAEIMNRAHEVLLHDDDRHDAASNVPPQANEDSYEP